MNYIEDNNIGPLIPEDDDHYLGEFNNVYDAMKRYPTGGLEGDYIIIFGVKHFWNINRQSWGSLKDREDNLVQMLENGLERASDMVTEMKTWVESSMEKVVEESKDYIDSFFRLVIKLSASEILFKKGTSPTVTLQWTVYLQGKEVTCDSTAINGEAMESPALLNPKADTTYILTATKGEESVSESISVVFVSPSYWGIVGSDFHVSKEAIKVLPSGDILKAGKEYSTSVVSLNGQKICYAYPKVMGELTSILDGNGFEVISAYTVSEITIDEEDYYVYLLSDAISGSGIKQIYS